MIVCCKCRLEMRCKKNEYGARWGVGHYYPGDLFFCPECNTEVISTNRHPIYNLNLPGLQMREAACK